MQYGSACFGLAFFSGIVKPSHKQTDQSYEKQEAMESFAIPGIVFLIKLIQ